MKRHRNPRPKVSKQPSPDNFDPGLLINQLYEELVEVEALAVTADEAVTELPPRPRGKYGRTMARLYTLVGKTSGRAQGALERGEELVALHAAHRVARAPSARRRVGRADLLPTGNVAGRRASAMGLARRRRFGVRLLGPLVDERTNEPG